MKQFIKNATSTKVGSDALLREIFLIMNHTMKLAMFNEHTKMKLFAVADTRFALVIISLRRFKNIKRDLQDLVLSDQRAMCRDDLMWESTIYESESPK